ncbi:MAG: GNAT superfamily N-acetyltransferase [Psychroserpens sp.]|jgi:GNAT superfamily N-acetyltransferase|uniref:GNAT family N-acetyltransferase n=1 Tax=Psychroserpens sp. TaxID=2020870 RepID=UPI0039E5B587
MIKIVRTDSKNKDFSNLIIELDRYLKITDQDEHEFYNQFNSIDLLNNVIIAYNKNKAVGCGAFKEFNATSVEIKRMFIKPEVRGTGVASEILSALELWASELNYKTSVLETGVRQKAAVAFYKKSNYKSITNYGQYTDKTNSLCFKKII